LEVIVSVLQQLFSDRQFVTLLGSEKARTAPDMLMQYIKGTEPCMEQPLEAGQVSRRRGALNGICDGVIKLLRGREVTTETFNALRKMKPLCQLEAALLMRFSANYTTSYATALLAATKKADLIAERKNKVGGLSREQVACMEAETEALRRDFSIADSLYRNEVLTLVIASGYVAKLLEIRTIEYFLREHHPEMFKQLLYIATTAYSDDALSRPPSPKNRDTQ
jgi:hypothetical protein